MLATQLMIPLLLPDWLDPAYIVETAGPWVLPVVALIIFAECGIFSILPGDSLLFTVGMFMAVEGAAGGKVISYGGSVGTTMVIVMVTLIIAAVLGNVVGYWIGRLIGPPIFKPRDSWVGRKLFNPVYVDKTHNFFEKYGNRALVLARFVPLVRTFVTLVAGVSKMNFRSFISWTAIGGVLWVVLVTLMGFFLGQITFIRENIDAALILIVFVSVIPMGIEYLNHRRQARRALVAAAETIASEATSPRTAE